MNEEFSLGMVYLNASVSMAHDSIARHGFAHMFKSFYQTQLSNMNTLREYIIKRGGVVETPHFTTRSLLNQKNHYENVTSTINHLLQKEIYLNREMLEVTRTASDHAYEVACQRKFGNVNYIVPAAGRKDPFTAAFLDSTFNELKLTQIKHMANLVSKVARVEGAGPGVHIIDVELTAQFSL